MAAPPSTVAFILCVVLMVISRSAEATWCVARSDASDQALQLALDYACGAGADCIPLLSNGLCFLPNTVLAHASYAFNSYYQRKAMAPGSCDFSGTATVAKTDPSYGSCVYPSSLSTAGGSVNPGGGTTTTPATTPILYLPPPPPPANTLPMSGDGFGPDVPGSPNSSGSQHTLAVAIALVSFMFLLAHIL